MGRLLLAALLTISAAAESAHPAASLIAGTVIDTVTGAPLPKAVVRLNLLNKDGSYAIDIADANGRFGFSYLPAGRYTLFAMKDGYEGGSYGGRKPGDRGTILTLSDNDQRWSVVLRLAQAGAITGTVVDPDGDPISGVQVQIFEQSWWRGKPHLQQAGSSNTDDRGQYRMGHLMPGSYIVAAMPYFRTFMQGKNVEQAGLAASYFPGSDRISRASPVQVSPGKEVSGIDFRLSDARTVTVKGRVTTPEGIGSDTPIQVTAYRQDVTNGSNFGTGTGGGGEDHAFQLGPFMPGSYQLVATADIGGKEYRGVKDLEVGESDIEDVTIPLVSGVDLSGSVKIEGPGAENYRHFQITLSSGDATGGFTRSRPADTRPDSSFTFKDVPAGIWDINVTPIPEGGYLKSMRLGDQDVLTEDMTIGSAAPPALNIVVSTQGAKVEGDVALPSRDPQQVIVLLAPEGKFNRVMSFYHTALADEKGHFSMNGLDPGTYLLYAFDEMEPRAFEDPEFLKRFPGEGEPVTLLEGQTAKVNLKLIRASLRGEGVR